MNVDPRLAASTVVDGPPDLIGDELVVVTEVTLDEVGPVYLPKPLPGVPDYVVASRAEMEADRLRPLISQNLDRSGAIPYQADTPLVLDFLAAAGSVATTATAGLEAFANHHLARFCPPPQYDENGDELDDAPTISFGDETLTFRDLTDRPLNERLGRILPELMSTPSPTGQPWWSKLRQVQALAALNRHGITDPVRRRGLSGIKSLVQRLCDREYAGAPEMMLAVFEFFAPGWISAERLSQLRSPPPR